jgi:hypothetical protein
MVFDKRIFIFLFTNGLLIQLMLLVNSGIPFFGLNLFLLGPVFILPPLYLRADHFFITSTLCGLWIDAALPTPFGFFTLINLIIGTLILLTRLRFRAEKNYHPCLLAHIANAATFSLLTIAYSLGSNHLFDLILSSLIELSLSHLILMMIAPWFFNLQRVLFSIFDSKTEPESLPFV